MSETEYKPGEKSVAGTETASTPTKDELDVAADANEKSLEKQDEVDPVLVAIE